MSRRQIRQAAGLFLIAWILVLLWLTVLGRPSADRVAYLIPFTTTASMLKDAPWYEIFYLLVGNIAWFVPIGFLLPLSTRIKPWLAILCGAGLSLLIEAGQYLFSVGCTDVDDLIFNTLGTAIGALVYVIVKKKLPHLF